jgi:DNA-binding transcriptional ArsR family regulator
MNIVRELDELWAASTFADAAARTEQLCGVLPLLDLFNDDPYGLAEQVRDRRRIAALGLFTPNALFALAYPTIRAIRDGDQIVLDGRFRYAVARADVSLVDIELEDQTRLALLPHTLEGVRVHGAGHAEDWGWGELTGAVLQARALSRPVSWVADGPLVRTLDDYGWEFARRSSSWTTRIIADLRRVLANTGVGTEALSTSQYIAHELSKLEIEISLAASAARFGPAFKGEEPGGQAMAAVLLSCTDLLRRSVRVAEDLNTELGLWPIPGADTDWPAASIHAYFGGRRMLESELARRMGLVRPETSA